MKRYLKSALCAMLILLLPLSACAPAQEPSHTSFQAMDTLMSLTVYGDDGVSDSIREKITALDDLFDATDQSSEIARLNAEKTAALSEDTAALLGRSLELCRELGGAFDVTVYPAVQAWGFLSGDYRVPDSGELAALTERIDYRRVSLSGSTASIPEDTQLDLGAIAKGYAADVGLQLLSGSRAQAAVLNLGGTVRLYGKKPDGSRFRVGVADPDNPAGYFGYLSLDSGVVATSGGYERYFEQDGTRYIHILDPQTAATVSNGILSVTIICDDGAAADALSTALFVMGRDKAIEYYKEHPDFDFILLDEDDRLYITEGIYNNFTLGSGFDFTLHKVN